MELSICLCCNKEMPKVLRLLEVNSFLKLACNQLSCRFRQETYSLEQIKDGDLEMIN